MDLLANFFREIPPISSNDSFLVYDRIRKYFDFPIHYHSEYELNFIINSKGVRRIVGNHTAEADDYELVLVGPNLYHGWETYNCKSKKIHEITIQFHQNLFNDELLSRAILLPIKEMFSRAKHGILFSTETAMALQEKILKIPKLEGIQYFLEITSLLYDLSQSKNQILLSTIVIDESDFDKNETLNKIHNYIQQNFSNKISLPQASKELNMSQNSLNRFLKKKMNKTFTDYVNDVRIGFATRWLIEKDMNISEIAFSCGFNNLANFNRIFLSKIKMTPKEYRQFYRGRKKII